MGVEDAFVILEAQDEIAARVVLGEGKLLSWLLLLLLRVTLLLLLGELALRRPALASLLIGAHAQNGRPDGRAPTVENVTRTRKIVDSSALVQLP